MSKKANSSYPELDRFDSREEAQRVLRTWQKSMMRKPQFWLTLLGYAATVPIVLVLLLHTLERWIDIPASVYGGLAGGVVGGSTMVMVRWLWRGRCRRFLRQELVARGVPVCLKCGYDLRGLSGPRCPECGRPFDAVESGGEAEAVENVTTS
jgi:hypothetical protein